jgi:hypothetical protein
MRGEFDVPHIASLTSVVSNYINAKEEDRAVPTEIVSAAIEAKLRERYDVNPALVAAEVIRLIVGIGDQNVFPDQLAILQSAAKNAG